VDYSILAEELIKIMHVHNKARAQKKINSGFQGEAFVLCYLSDHGGELLPGDLKNGMEVSSARIAQTLNSIESKGYITRHIDPNDRRRIIT